MEKNITSAMAENYWLTETKVVIPGFFFDYITNPAKRFETGIASHIGNDFWRKYANAYTTIKDSGGLIFRIKIVTTDSITIKQIYQTKDVRDSFISLIDTHVFYDKIGIPFTESERCINEVEKEDIINKARSNDYVIVQYLRPDHYRSGIVIGDPLKGESLVSISD